MEDARIRAFSRLLGSKIRTLLLPLAASAAFFAASGTAHATPECQNLGAGDPMTTTGDVVTGGDDTCKVTSASPQTNPVDALGQSTTGADLLQIDGTTTAFTFDATRIGTATGYQNFEAVELDGTVTLTGANSTTATWAVASHGVVQGTATLLGSLTNDGTLSPGPLGSHSYGTMTITGNYTTSSVGSGSASMDVDLIAGTHDLLHVGGNITGATYIDIVQNQVGTGVATTGNGILLWQIGGTGGLTNFALDPSVPVISGAYQYILNYVTDYSGTDDGLFLKSALRPEFYGNAALLAGGQAMVRSCFRSDQRIPDAPSARDNVRAWGQFESGSFKTGEDTGVKMDDQMDCANGGLDVGIGDGIRFGVVGGYGKSSIDVTTPGLPATLDGSTEAVEALLSIGTPMYFFNVTGGFATTDWSYKGPTVTADATQRGIIGSAQAGATVNVTPFRFKFIGAVNYDHTSCGDNCLLAGMTESTGILEAKGTIRLEAMTHQINPYVAVSLSNDISGDNRISMNGETLTADPGHNLLSLNAGFTAPIDNGVTLYADVSVLDGMGNATSGYTAAGGFKAFW